MRNLIFLLRSGRAEILILKCRQHKIKAMNIKFQACCDSDDWDGIHPDHQ